jgi:hypothetical protein
VFDGCRFSMGERAGGEIVFDYRPRALFHLSADHHVLRCAPAEGGDASWQRVLLDTVLWAISFLRGLELVHASAVETPVGVVAFLAGRGAGKSSLALEWLRRGGRLFSDDIVALEQVGERVLAHPGPPLMNLPTKGVLPDPDGLEPVAQIEGERWVHVKHHCRHPQPLAAIVLLERVGRADRTRSAADLLAGCGAGCQTVEATMLTLLPHGVGLSHTRERAARRFVLFGALAAATPVHRLAADATLPVGELVDRVEQSVILSVRAASPLRSAA